MEFRRVLALRGANAWTRLPVLETLLDYWRAVERSTLTYLAALTDEESKQIVIVHDAPEERYTVDDLL